MARRMAFRFWVDDFEGGTSYMTNEEVGAYLRLLLYQFRNGSIPVHIAQRISHGLTTVQPVLSKFTLVDGNYVQHRMAEIREDSIKFSENQSTKGKKSAESRANRGSTVVQPPGSGRGSGNDSEMGIGGTGEKGKTFFELSIGDEGWHETLMRTCKISNPVHWITEFNDHSKSTEEHYNLISDWRRHCTNWIKKELRLIEKRKKDGKQPVKQDRIESIREWGERMAAGGTGESM